MLDLDAAARSLLDLADSAAAGLRAGGVMVEALDRTRLLAALSRPALAGPADVDRVEGALESARAVLSGAAPAVGAARRAEVIVEAVEAALVSRAPAARQPVADPVPVPTERWEVRPAGPLAQAAVDHLGGTLGLAALDGLAAAERRRIVWALDSLETTLRLAGLELAPDTFGATVAPLLVPEGPLSILDGDLGHVPRVVQSAVRAASFEAADAGLEADARQEALRAAFFAALLHDAGKRAGRFDIDAVAFRRLPGGPGGPADLRVDTASRSAFPDAGALHQDALPLLRAVRDLASGLGWSEGLTDEVCGAIRGHSFVSFFILDLAASTGVESSTFLRDRARPFTEGYVRLVRDLTASHGPLLDAGILASAPERVAGVRERYRALTSPVSRALNLADHLGQVDIGKWVRMLATAFVRDVPRQSAFGMLLGSDARGSVGGIMERHFGELLLLHPERCAQVRPVFDQALAWLHAPVGQPGLRQAIVDDAELGPALRDGDAATTDRRVLRWLEGLALLDGGAPLALSDEGPVARLVQVADDAAQRATAAHREWIACWCPATGGE